MSEQTDPRECTLCGGWFNWNDRCGCDPAWAEVAGHNIPDMNHPKVTVADVTFDNPIRVGQTKRTVTAEQVERAVSVMRFAHFDDTETHLGDCVLLADLPTILASLGIEVAR